MVVENQTLVEFKNQIPTERSDVIFPAITRFVNGGLSALTPGDHDILSSQYKCYEQASGWYTPELKWERIYLTDSPNDEEDFVEYKECVCSHCCYEGEQENGGLEVTEGKTNVLRLECADTGKRIEIPVSLAVINCLRDMGDLEVSWHSVQSEKPNLFQTGLEGVKKSEVIDVALSHAWYKVAQHFPSAATFYDEQGQKEVLVGIELNPGPTDMVNFTPHFKLHGNYVGPGHTGALKLGQQYWNAKPIDALDAAARTHDWHYAKHPRNRGRADAILSKAAFAAAPKLKGWAKAKAYGVGAGMWAMSKIGSYSDEPLTYPPRYKKRLVGVEENPGPGNKAIVNGKFTKNTPKKYFKKLASKRLAAFDKRRAVKNKVGKSGPKKRPIPPKMGDRMGGWPNMLPIVSQSPTLKNFMPCKEKVKLSPIVSPAGTIYPNEVFFSYSFDRNLFNPTQIGRYFSMFDEWENLGITLEIVPAEPTNTAGLLWVVVDPDAADTLTGGTVKSANFFSGHKGAKEHSVFGERWFVRLPGTKRRLFCDAPALTGGPNVNNPDVRISSAGNVAFAASDGFSLVSTQIASVWAHVDFKFYSAALTDDGDVYACTKAMAYSGQVLASSGTSWNVAQQQLLYGSSVNSNTTNGLGYFESCYNPAILNSGVPVAGQPFLYLPAGNSYYIKFSMAFSGAMGALSWSLIGSSSQFSSDAQLTGTVSGPPEWEGNPTGLATITSTNGFTVAGEVRLTNSGGSTPFAPLQLIIITTNSVFPTLFILYIAKLPSNISSPFKTHFPKGNSLNAIEVKPDGQRIHVLPKVAVRNILIRNDDYQQYLDWQRNKMKYLQFDVDEKDSSDLRENLEEERVRARNMVRREPETPDSPEMVENPMTKSVHMSSTVASQLLSLVGRK